MHKKKIELTFFVKEKAITTNMAYFKDVSSPAICIPRVFKNISEARIAAIFRKLDIGEIQRIDMVPQRNQNGEEYYRVFLHLVWGSSQNALATREELLKPNCEIKVVYDDPWFWKLRASNSKGRRERIQRPEPFIDFNATSTTTSAEVSSSVSEKTDALHSKIAAVQQGDLHKEREELERMQNTT